MRDPAEEAGTRALEGAQRTIDEGAAVPGREVEPTGRSAAERAAIVKAGREAAAREIEARHHLRDLKARRQALVEPAPGRKAEPAGIAFDPVADSAHQEIGDPPAAE